MPLDPDAQQRLDALKRFFVLDHTAAEDEITRLVRVAAQVYGVAYAVLTLREEDGERIAAAYGFDPTTVPEDAVFCTRPVGPSIPLAVADASADERFATNPLVHGEQQARFYASVPLKSRDGFTLGTLALMDASSQELNGEGLAMLVDLGTLVEPALNLAHARDEATRAGERLEQVEASLQEATAALEKTTTTLAEAQHKMEERAADHEALATLEAERDALLDERDALQAAHDAAVAERDALFITAETAEAALGRREALTSAALAAAEMLAATPDAVSEALGVLAAAAGATRAVLFGEESDPVCLASWHAPNIKPLAAPGEALAGHTLGAWAAQCDAAHPVVLAFPGQPSDDSGRAVAFDFAEPPTDETELTALRAALAALTRPTGTEEITPWAALIEASPAPTLLATGLAGELRYANTAAAALLGLDPEAIGGQRLPEFIAPGDTEAVVAFLAQAHHTTPAPIEVLLVDAAGAERHLEIQGGPAEAEGQGTVQIILHDVSAAARTADALRTARMQAEAEARASSRFFAGVSREMRATLAALAGYAERLAGSEDAEARALAEPLLDGNARLLKTLNAVVDMARLEAETREDTIRPVSITSLVEVVADAHRPRAEARDLAFFAEGTDLDVYAWADASALACVLDNLLSNALTYTAQGGVRLRIAAEDDWVCVEVQDTGVGIGEDRLPHLFDGPEQETGRDDRGAGLGLAISKRLVELMGGQITVTSLEGQGSVFRVVLRSAPSNPAAKRKATRREARASGSPVVPAD